MANKLLLPKDEHYYAVYYLGNRFRKGAELSKCFGTYVFIANGEKTTAEVYNLQKNCLNKKFNKNLKYGFFDKYVNTELYFVRKNIYVPGNSTDSKTFDFKIEEDGIGETHNLKIRSTLNFHLELINYSKVFNKYVEQEKKQVVERSEIHKIFFEIAKRATKAIYGKLPWGQYHIDNELKYLDPDEKTRADEWFKLVNEELKEHGYKFDLDWIK